VLFLPSFSKTWDDLVFTRRNKSYGAYELRRATIKYQIWGLASTIFIFSTSILYIQYRTEEVKPAEFEFEKMVEFKGFDANLIDVSPVKKEQAPPPAKKADLPTENIEKKDLPPKVIEDKPVEVLNKKNAVVDTALKKSEKEGKDSVKKFETGADSGQVLVKYEEGPASYYGGITEFSKWVSMNIRCPREVIESMMVQATVDVFFNIDAEGNVKDVRVLRGFNTDCDKEVVRVIQSSQKWKPRVINGIPTVQRNTVKIIINPNLLRSLKQYK
jgi:protein TonB